MTDKTIHIYLAGSIESAGGNMNWPLFRMVAERLRQGIDCIVFSPTEYAEQVLGPLDVIKKLSKHELKLARRNLMKHELVWICNNADYVLMLPGWQQSPGARAERMVAEALDIPIRELPNTVLLDETLTKWDVTILEEQR